MTSPLILSGEIRVVNVEDLSPHPENARDSDVGAICESIKRNGWYGKVLCQRREDGSLRIIVGEHRWRAAKEVGLTEIPIEIIEIDDATARRILLVDNRTSDLASWDEGLLAELLKDIAAGGIEELCGTGHDGDSLDALLKANAECDISQVEPKERGMVTCPECGHKFKAGI